MRRPRPGVHRRGERWLATLPGLFDFLWSSAFDLAQVSVIVIAVLASARRRWALLRDWAVSLALTGRRCALRWMGRGRLAPHAVRQHRSRGRIGRLPVVGARRQRCGDHRSEPVPRQPTPQVRSMAHGPRLDLGAGIRGGRARCGVVCGRDRLGRRCAGPPRLRLTRWDTVAARSRRIAAIDRRRCRASERGGPPRGDVRPATTPTIEISTFRSTAATPGTASSSSRCGASCSTDRVGAASPSIDDTRSNTRRI